MMVAQPITWRFSLRHLFSGEQELNNSPPLLFATPIYKQSFTNTDPNLFDPQRPTSGGRVDVLDAFAKTMTATTWQAARGWL